MTITLVLRSENANFGGVVRGRAVDSIGSPISDAIVRSVGVIVGKASLYGSIEGLEPIAVTNRKGEFEISYARPTPGMLLGIEARAMAPKFIAMNTGPERHFVVLSEGATITGRLVANGKPVSHAEIGLIAKHMGGFADNLSVTGDPYDEMRIGTRLDGSFTITNVPVRVNWYLYAKMDSVSNQGATNPVEVKTTSDRQYVIAKDLVLRPGYRLKGEILLGDKKRIPDGMRVTIGSDRVWDSQTATLSGDGRFEFTNLPKGTYHISPSVKGYRMRADDQSADPSISVDHDVDGFTINLYPDSFGASPH